MANRLYLVAFDLLSPGDYASLKARLTTMGAHQILENVSAILASESAPEIKQILKCFLDDGDRILVVEVGRDWASRHALFPVGELMDPHSPAKCSGA